MTGAECARIVLAEMGVQTSPAALQPPPAAPPRAETAGPSVNRSMRLTSTYKQTKAAKPLPARSLGQDASRGKRSSRPDQQCNQKDSPVEQASKPKLGKPDVLPPARRVTRQSAAAAPQQQQPARTAAPVLSFSRRRRQSSQQQGQEVTQQPSQPVVKRLRVQLEPPAPSTSNAALLFDSLFGEDQEVQQPQQQVDMQAWRPLAQHAPSQEEGQQDVPDEGEHVLRIVKAKMQQHRAKLMRRRSNTTRAEP
jgi:hypothetical protein